MSRRGDAASVLERDSFLVPTVFRNPFLFPGYPPGTVGKVTFDQAIIDHDTPTYKALHTKFDLAAKRISFAAFYRYARRPLSPRLRRGIVPMHSSALRILWHRRLGGVYTGGTPVPQRF